ncbi:hypothetical protein D3C85_1677760 [compost metagenome]
MIRIRIAESMPAFVRCNGPAFGFINLFRLPDIKEPAVGLIFKSLYFFTEMQRTFH